MADNAKPAPPLPPRRSDARPAKPPAPVITPGSIMSAARAAALEAALEKRPYLRFAFANPYNLSLLLGAVGLSVITLNPLLALVALGAEGLWLLHAPESKRLQHVLWDPKFESLRRALEAQARAERLKPLSADDRERVETLVAKQEEIQTLAGQNPSFTGELLRGELVKTDRLVQAFIDMAITCTRYEQYLDSVDLDALDHDRTRWEKLSRGTDQDPRADIAKKNLAIILRRLDKMQEIRRYLTVARGQLDLIQNSFQLIADQIVTMQSPQELSGQLDELLGGVESIRETAADTERMLNAIGIGNTP
jgi:hypothetical protein